MTLRNQISRIIFLSLNVGKHNKVVRLFVESLNMSLKKLSFCLITPRRVRSVGVNPKSVRIPVVPSDERLANTYDSC